VQSARARASVLIAVIALVACDRSPYPELAVGESSPAKREAPIARADSLRLSVAAMLSPQATYGAYAHLLERIAANVGADLELFQRRSYREVNALLERGEIDAALLCTGGYLELEGRSADRIEVLAVPVVDGQLHYRSLVIVPADSPVTTLAELAGRRLALTDELSLTGYRYPVQALAALGIPADQVRHGALITRSHDRSIEAVEGRLVAAAAVDSLIYQRTLATDPSRAARTRVVHTSPAFGMPPLVVRRDLAPERRERLREAVLAIDRDPAASAYLEALGIERFVPPPAGLYDSARAIAAAGGR
jgi:phosphonate transport system substrate-binding protein